MQATIGIVGNGFVGNAVAQGFKDKVSEVRVYDIDKDKSTHGYVETINSDYIFVCLPTPMIDAGGGKCNLSIIERFFEEIPRIVEGTIIIIFGGDYDLSYGVRKLFEICFPDSPSISIKSKESELVKYFSNCFLASKVMIFNEMKSLCEKIEDIDYETIVFGVGMDGRIGRSHTSVPGPDGDYGFGGTCFPKDINALIHTM